ncbi:pyruvate dehydrogenase protein X component, mitochondrial-like [Mya arenaria]|uniref:pyruvate dehydrogenase protein X component, mitochondrial-like n=1 Tax=Mya arenaria TaxID=6604 RepID=UPI0022DF140F|nr:pyruvate dehydrogenase protein X component, mitochondrial-like [Mya arenaria]
MASAVLNLSRVIRKTAFSPRYTANIAYLLKKNEFHNSSSKYASSEICMPSLSPTMSEGTIVKWYKKEGDVINAGDVLCDVQTDKAVVSFDTEDDGILAKILKPENTTDIKVGALIAIMVEEGDDWQNVEVPAETEAAPSSPAPPTQDKPTPDTPIQPLAGATKIGHDELHGAGIGPSVRKLLEEYGVHVKDVQGAGPQGRITKGDVLKVIKAKNLQRQAPPSGDAPQSPPPSGAPAQPTMIDTSAAGGYVPTLVPEFDGEEYIDIPNTGMRSTIAKRLTLSKTTIPHSYATMDCNVGPVTALRKQLIKDSIKVSVNDFIIKSAALALQRVPQVNSVWQNDEPASMLNVDICVAVATDNGLITPIVQNTPQLAVDEISSTVKDLAERARANKLQLHEFQGGTFTISNLGMFGIGEFSAVINPPQTAILAVGSSRLAIGQNGKPESRMAVTLSYDARVIDDSEASLFLEVFRDIIENPSLLVSGRPASKRQDIL